MCSDFARAGPEDSTPLDGMLITADLDHRPSRSPDYETQAKALDVLATALASAPENALQELAEVVVELCNAGSAGVSVAEESSGLSMFRWAAVAGAWSEKRGGTMPIDASPCGVVIERNAVLLFARPERHFPAANVEPLIAEVLLVPLQIGQKTVGTVWAIAHDPERKFDREDVRLLVSLSRLAGAMVQANTSLRGLNDSEARLKRLHADLEREVAARSRERSFIWQHSPDLLSVIDVPSGTFQRINPAWTTALGWTSEEMEGRSLAEFVHCDDLDASNLAIGGLRQHEPVLCFESRCRAKDGSWHWFSSNAVLVGKTLYASSRDITAEKAQAAVLAQTEEALRQSQKMEAVGQLTGGLAHDFNNMLQAIGGALQLMERRVKDGQIPEVPRLIRAALEGVDRAAALTQRLLAFARRGQLESRTLVVDELVAGLTDLVRRTVGPSIEVRTQLRGGRWRIHLDSSGLESALLNLAINARDAMPEGGALTFSTSEVTLSEKDLGPESEVGAGDFVLISATDSGVGMPPDVLARVFEPFFTTKPIGEGTGLGLSQVYGFIRQSGGLVQIASKVGAGTTVRLLLPRDDREAEQPDGVSRSGERLAAEVVDQTVVLVEDEAAVRMLATEALREAGYNVLEASDGPSGLALLAGTARVDLLVTDVGLPGLNGRQLADAARERHPTLPVLFITGYAGAALDNDLPAGMSIVSKPFTLSMLADKVADILALARISHGPV